MSQSQAPGGGRDRAPARAEEPGAIAPSRANGLLLALQFLTVLPVRPTGERSGKADAPDMGRALPWFPLVGALVGAGVVALNWALDPVFSRSLRDVIAMAALLLMTGLLHFDGFLDCCDALLGSRSVERRLEILRDSHVGAYGVGGGALLLLARYTALESLTPGLWALALVAAVLAGRWAMVWVITLYPYARAQGVGSGFRCSPGRLALASGMAIAILGTLAALDPWGTLARRIIILAILSVLGLVIALLWTLWASRQLGGGLTGDTYGATNELVELAVLALAPAAARLASLIL